MLGHAELLLLGRDQRSRLYSWPSPLLFPILPGVSIPQLLTSAGLRLYDREVVKLPPTEDRSANAQHIAFRSRNVTDSRASSIMVDWSKRGAVDEAQRRIQQAYESDARELVLSSLSLTSLPESLGELTQLAMLYVTNNQLVALPGSLGQLTQLQYLDLHDNQLMSLPESLRQLGRLEELYLHRSDALGLPIEVLGPTFKELRRQQVKPAKPAEILEYYFRVCGDKRPRN